MGSPLFVLIFFVVSLPTKKMCISCLNKMHVILSARNNCSSTGQNPSQVVKRVYNHHLERKGVFILDKLSWNILAELVELEVGNQLSANKTSTSAVEALSNWFLFFTIASSSRGYCDLINFTPSIQISRTPLRIHRDLVKDLINP